MKITSNVFYIAVNSVEPGEFILKVDTANQE